MAKKPKYRLEPLLIMKVKAKKQKEMDLAKAIKELDAEKVKLEDFHKIKRSLQFDQQKVKDRMRDQMATGQAQVRQSQYHFNYIDKLKDDEGHIDREIEDQEFMIEKADRKVKRVRRDYIDAATEVNMLEKHKELWQKKVQEKLSFEENKLMNELGNNVFQINKMKS